MGVLAWLKTPSSDGGIFGQNLWLSAVPCGYPAMRNRKLQRSFKQKVAKVSKRNVLRRSKIFIAVPWRNAG